MDGRRRCAGIFNRCPIGRKKYYVAPTTLPRAGSHSELEHKPGESVWWLMVLAERADIDTKEAICNFLPKDRKTDGMNDLLLAAFRWQTTNNNNQREPGGKSAMFNVRVNRVGALRGRLEY